jgi:hypothetical protein
MFQLLFLRPDFPVAGVGEAQALKSDFSGDRTAYRLGVDGKETRPALFGFPAASGDQRCVKTALAIFGQSRATLQTGELAVWMEINPTRTDREIVHITHINTELLRNSAQIVYPASTKPIEAVSPYFLFDGNDVGNPAWIGDSSELVSCGLQKWRRQDGQVECHDGLGHLNSEAMSQKLLFEIRGRSCE